MTRRTKILLPIMKTVHRWVIRLQKKRVRELEASLKEAREQLKESQEAYVRAFVTKYWRGKDLLTGLKDRAS